MLFVIPGFPLITAGLDIAKLDMRSGIERLSYAVSIIVMATLVGWMVAECVGLAPDDFAPLGLSPLALTLLRMLMSFIGVFGFSVMFNSPVKMAAAAGLIGAVSNTLRLTLVDAPTLLPFLGLSAGMPPEAAAFTGALVSGLLASLAEIKLTYPRIALTVPSIVIMVPGLYLYRSMYYMCTFRHGQYARLVCACSAHRGVSARWAGCGAHPHRPSLAPYQLIGARGTGYFAPNELR